MRFSFRSEFFVTLAVAATATVLVTACTRTPEQSAPTNGQVAKEALADSQTDEADPVARPIVVMLGDSLTAGYELRPQDALPEQIQTKLDAQSVVATVLNAGVSGDTTRGGLERYDWSVKGANADILLIALGANDFLSGMNAQAPRANLAALIDRAQADDLMVGLIGVSIPKQEGLDSRDLEFDAIYPSLAAQYAIPLFPNMMAPVFGHPEHLMSDGIHPTAEGVDLMAEELSEFLTELIKEWRSARSFPLAE